MTRSGILLALVALSACLAAPPRAQAQFYSPYYFSNRYYYNPYLGGAVAGAYYNPWTGGMAARQYGYNAWNGAYYGGAAFYNPWTGLYGAQRGFYNPWNGLYGYRWYIR